MAGKHGLYLIISSVWVGLLLSLSVSTPSQSQTEAAEIFQLINTFRAELGLPPFQYNAQLAAAAQQQSDWMSVNNLYVHTWPDGTTKEMRAVQAGYSGRVIENIVGGWDMSPRQGLTWWQNSPVHYNTLVSSRYIEAGTGFTQVGNQHYYVLVVGLPSNAPAPSTSSSNERAAEESAPLIVAPIILSSPAEDGSITHIVGDGQALWTLAAYYDVPLSDLILYNNYPNESVLLRPGDSVTIRLADGQAPPPTATPPLTHTVREGQTLWTISALYDLPIADLIWWNGLQDDTILQPGQELKVRLQEGELPPPTATPQLTYIVQPGDALWGISARYGLTIDELLALNGLPAGTVLQPGQALQIRPSDPDQEAPIVETPVPETTPLVSDYPPTFTPAPQVAPVSDSAEPTPIAIAVLDDEDGVVEEAELESQPAPFSEGRGPFPWTWAAIAAAIVLIGLGGFFLWVSSRS